MRERCAPNQRAIMQHGMPARCRRSHSEHLDSRSPATDTPVVNEN